MDTRRTDLLTEELAAVRGELTRVDSKASMLLALAAGGMAVVATADQHRLAAVLLVNGGMVSVGLALVLLLSVVRPRLGVTGFLRHAGGTIDDVRAELTTCDADVWRSQELACLSRIARRKYELLRSAVDLLSLALALILAGLLAGLG
jgi:hypothetical protein